MGFIVDKAIGTVLNSAGNPKVGAKVSNANLNLSVLTDENGKFSLTGSVSQQITISCDGYKTIQVEGTAVDTIYKLDQEVPEKVSYSLIDYIRMYWVPVVILIVIILLWYNHYKENAQ